MHKAILCLTVLLLSTPWLSGQRHKDPLNEDEIDQIREYADRPPERVKLYLKFIDERAVTLKEVTADLRTPDRKLKIRNRLDELTNLIDELQDNVDEYDHQHADLRKVLKELIPASEKWLDIIKAAPSDGSYDLGKKGALDAASSLCQSLKETLLEEEKYFATHKPEKVFEKKER